MMLTAQRARELLAYDPATGALRWLQQRARFMPGDLAGGFDAEGYLCVMIDGKTYKCHRVAWLITTGEFPLDLIDHRNGMRADNRWENLRVGNKAINAQNQRKAAATSTVGFLGVSRQPSGRYQARIGSGGKNIPLGTFDTPEQAHAAYVVAKRRLHPGCLL